MCVVWRIHFDLITGYNSFACIVHLSIGCNSVNAVSLLMYCYFFHMLTNLNCFHALQSILLVDSLNICLFIFSVF